MPPRRATGILSSFLIFKLEHTRVDPQTRSHGPSGQGFVTGKTALQKYKRESRNKESTKKYKEGIEKLIRNTILHSPQ